MHILEPEPEDDSTILDDMLITEGLPTVPNMGEVDLSMFVFEEVEMEMRFRVKPVTQKDMTDLTYPKLRRFAYLSRKRLDKSKVDSLHNLFSQYGATKPRDVGLGIRAGWLWFYVMLIRTVELEVSHMQAGLKLCVRRLAAHGRWSYREHSMIVPIDFFTTLSRS